MTEPKNTPDFSATLRLLEEVCMRLLREGNHEAVIETAENLLRDRDGTWTLHAGLTIAYYSRSDYDTASMHAQKARNLAETDLQLFLSHGLFAMIQSARGDRISALKHLKHCLSLCEKIEDKSKQIPILTAMARMYTDEGKLNQALKHYRMVLNLSSSPHEHAAILRDIAHLYWSMKNYKQAIHHYRKALELYREVGNGSMASLIMLILAHLYIQTRDFSAALDLIQEALSRARQADNRKLECAVLECLLQYQLVTENYRDALETCYHLVTIAGREKLNLDLSYIPECVSSILHVAPDLRPYCEQLFPAGHLNLADTDSSASGI